MTPLVAPDPDFEARIRGSFGRQGFMAHIGAHIEDIEPGRCVVAVAFRPEVSQQHGFFHGGLVGSLVDNAGAYAAFTLIEARQSMLTVEFKVNLLAPAVGDRLRAIGHVVRTGRTLSTSHVDVFSVTAGREKHCAVGIVTLMILSDRGDG